MTKKIRVKNLFIGGEERITVQSMTNVPTSDFDKLYAQVCSLISCGCDLVRIAVCSPEEVSVCKKLIPLISVPLVADIQFDYKLAIACSDIGFAKVRINPGNIGDEHKLSELVAALKANRTPLRIGVNSGSLQQDLLEKFGKTPRSLAQSALNQANLLKEMGFDDIILSAKSSSVADTVETYRILSRECDYPLHIGVTESGDSESGIIKSSIGIGSLLMDGIGDTLRVSLSAPPEEEVKLGKAILRALRKDIDYCEIISCPTCSRCGYDLFGIVAKVKELTKNIKKPLKVAVMGCVVNGPGEAADCDIGVAGGKDKAVIFKKGKIIKTIAACDILSELEQMIKELV